MYLCFSFQPPEGCESHVRKKCPALTQCYRIFLRMLSKRLTNVPCGLDTARPGLALPCPQGMPPAKRVLWELLFADMSQFDDYRQNKADSAEEGNHVNIPDFRHKQSDVGLW